MTVVASNLVSEKPVSEANGRRTKRRTTPSAAVTKPTWVRGTAGGLSLIGTIALVRFWRQISPTVQEALGLSDVAWQVLIYGMGVLLLVWVLVLRRRNRPPDEAAREAEASAEADAAGAERRAER